MTIDERLQALTERHEALTQTVEIIAGMQRASETRTARLEEASTHMMEAITRLANIAAAHEHRIDDLEQQH